MSKISDFRLLSFDVYGTLIDAQTGVLQALQPLLDANNASFPPEELLKTFNELEHAQQVATPDLEYNKLLAKVHAQLASRLGLPAPAAAQSAEFGASVGQWPAFPDTVDALRRLGRHYKLVVLSNVDRESFAATNAGPLGGVPFDAVLTAQDIGSYKPDRRNFEYLLREVEARFGVGKAEVLQTAQSQFHDTHPAREIGIRSVWIERSEAIVKNSVAEVYDWKFDTLGEFADALEKELKA